jgi:mannose-6-phosphate isomerase-like protein (cupin superfamily)
VLSRNLQDFVQFSPDGVRRNVVFETDHLWSQVLCFDRNQHVGPVADPDSDGLFTILAGEAVFLVDRRRKRLKQWEAVLVPAGSQVTVTNASVDPLVVMVVTSPPPVADAVTG